MKRFLAILLFVIVSMGVSNAQEIVFSKFELWKNMLVPEHKTLDYQFKSMADKEIKYLHIYWFAVNTVGDVTDGTVSALDHTPTKVFRRHTRAVGPIKPNKKSAFRVQPAIITVLSVTAIPEKVIIEYMDGTSWEIEITKDNYLMYFPKLKWIDYTKPDITEPEDVN